jgi:hypothetical protein
MDLGRVFVSSVFGGMLDLRDLAADAARLVGLERTGRKSSIFPVMAACLKASRQCSSKIRKVTAPEADSSKFRLKILLELLFGLVWRQVAGAHRRKAFCP